MGVKERIKSFLTKTNPIAKRRIKDMRRRLENTTPTFFCPNCIGGILFHDLGLQFRSPTINLMMTQTDFVKFIKDPSGYLAKDFVFFKHEEYTCPCARLGDVAIHFTHYATEEEAVKKWKTRAERIDPENTFVFLAERDGLTENDIRSLKELRVKGLVVFTARPYDDIPYAVPVDTVESDGQVGNVLKQSLISGQRVYEKYFDFVRWFNEANGGDYDVKKFIK